MKLILNAGSTSLKAALIGAKGERHWQGQRAWNPQDLDQRQALIGQWLLPAVAAEIAHAQPQANLELVAHRIVHGGERFIAPTRLDAAALAELEALTPLAPLHNGPALAVVRAMATWISQEGSQFHQANGPISQWACFDTAFHHSLPEAARTFAIPSSWRRQGLRRYGFHGLSHQHIAAQLPVSRLISCHLGGGCSLCAIKAGRSIATTMGFTPLDGLVMASRCGSLDPGVLLHQLGQGLSSSEIGQALSQQSGLLGLSELSGDLRELRVAAAAGHGPAQLAIEVFSHQLVAGIGAMAACLGGVDAIALTGGIGENDLALFSHLQASLAWLQPFELVRIASDEEGVIASLCGAINP